MILPPYSSIAQVGYFKKTSLDIKFFSTTAKYADIYNYGHFCDQTFKIITNSVRSSLYLWTFVSVCILSFFFS